MFGRKCCHCKQNFMGCGCHRPNNMVMENQVIEPTITKCIEQECYHEVPQE